MPISKEISARFLAQIQQEVKSLEDNLATEKGDLKDSDTVSTMTLGSFTTQLAFAIGEE
ncbi:MAG: hypothetical protein ACP5RN_14555 [Armatimonadota bacterium]